MKSQSLAILVIFALAAAEARAQTPTVLHSFNGTDGNFDDSGLLVQGSTLYGETNEGGAAGYGNVFSMATSGGAVTNLYSFNPSTGVEGYYPYFLTLNGSTLYGTTVYGGGGGYGVAYSISTTGGAATALVNFDGSNGSVPVSAFAVVGSTLFGTTSGESFSGPPLTDGTIYKVNSNGLGFQTLLTFSGTGGATPGQEPHGNLVTDGSTLYGVTNSGGAYNEGTVFKVNTDGSAFQTLMSFSGTNGDEPNQTLLLDGSTLYGTTLEGGTNGDGSVFKINTNGSGFQLLHSFANDANGYSPNVKMVEIGSTLYGATSEGGVGGISGAVFEIGKDGSGFQTIAALNSSTGGEPTSLATDGTLIYVANGFGGVYNDGTIISVMPPAPAPEPGTLVLLSAAAGLVGAGYWRRRKAAA